MLNLLFYEFERPVPGGFSDCLMMKLLSTNEVDATRPYLLAQ